MKWVKKRRKSNVNCRILFCIYFTRDFALKSLPHLLSQYEVETGKKGKEKICSISFFFVNFVWRGNRTRKKFYFILNWLYFFSFPISHWKKILVLFSNEKKKSFYTYAKRNDFFWNNRNENCEHPFMLISISMSVSIFW